MSKKAFVIPSSFVPDKPKEMDSFLFPSLYHVAAIQHEGLKYFDASTSTPIPHSTPLVVTASADGPGAASMSGFVGHSRKQGCQLYCEIIGWR